MNYADGPCGEDAVAACKVARTLLGSHQADGAN